MDEKNKGNSELLQNKSRISPASYSMSERVMKDVINRSTTDLLVDIAKVLRDNFKPYYPFRTKEVHDQKPFYDKISHLSDENIDIGKSIDRGFRDLIKGDKLKTEMKQKIKSELIDPLREHINKKEINPRNPKEEINAQLDAIEEKYFSASKGRE